ncbi:amidohydrolase family protein [Actinomadura luteofluorescens]
MLDGRPLIDAHVHAARLPTLRPAWRRWAEEFGSSHPWQDLYDEDGALVPERVDAYFEGEGVDVALLLCEYSPRTTGTQPIEDLRPLLEHNPRRFKPIANVNPHLHYPVGAEVERQLGLGAVALKLHPVHGGFSVADAELYPAYQVCRDAGVPVVVHCGTSSFPGSVNRYADPAAVDDVLRLFPGLTFVLAHGGRGWWYDAAAFLALSREEVWIELSGLPPRRLPEYYARHDLKRLARKFVFGTDWPGVPGIARNARAIAALGLDEETLALVLAGNALQVYKGLTVPAPTREDRHMPDAGPFTDDVVRQIARHMNEDHAADCLTICRALGGRPGATAARMTGLDAEGIEFAVADGGVEHPVRIPFGERLTERPQVRREVVRMTERARAALGGGPDVPGGP